MSCECYKIGGPFIAEDPDCPIHGNASIRREALRSKAGMTDDPDELREIIDEIFETLY